MTTKKVVVIGIDGMDRELVEKFEKFLPNLKRLKENSPKVDLVSVFPPDSPTAWATIYTGLSPAEHGVVFFKDPLNPKKAGEHMEMVERIKGKTFWDIASKEGRKVCVVFPHMGYPPWEVNGIMIGRTTEVDLREFDIKTYPEDIMSKYHIKERKLMPVTSFPLSLDNFLERTKEVLYEEVKLGVELLKKEDWDLFFIYFNSLDNVEHVFWRYFDPEDPYYEPGNKYEKVIPEFYKLYDELVIGSFLREIDEDTILIVLSDHGHAMRPWQVVNINEILRQEKLLYSVEDTNKSKITSKLLIETKSLVTKLIDKYRLLGKIASLLLRAKPDIFAKYTKIAPIDFKRTVAYLSDPSGGLKAYSYAGIKIIRENISPGESYESIRAKIIDLLLSIRDEQGTQLVEWALPREKLYSGPHLEKYPDVVFKLKDTWGVGWNIGKGKFGVSDTHRLHSGNHRMETPVFFVYTPPSTVNRWTVLKRKATLMDISPTILNILGAKWEKYYFNGMPIVKISNERDLKHEK
ncbi:alkaline phosphatase family protein [Pyrococcus kukulkanii]|uniref:alkaline phosphatase family protein n=1 Tax=Pyrococcus kukulkanii TaxID=1609559 RepID=UPI003565B940